MDFNTKEIGDLGEGIACRFLVKRGFKVVDRNFWKKWGEIDIVATKKNRLHFVEVKTVQDTFQKKNFSRETNSGDYRPEENVHPQKLQRMRRVVQSYLLEKKKEDKAWQFNVLTVVLNIKDKTARCNFLEDIIL